MKTVLEIEQTLPRNKNEIESKGGNYSDLESSGLIQHKIWIDETKDIYERIDSIYHEFTHFLYSFFELEEPVCYNAGQKAAEEFKKHVARLRRERKK